MKYETRYCAFVDILGFVSLIDGLTKGSIAYSEIREALRTVHASSVNPKAGDFKDSDLRAQSISDAVCLSSACSQTGLAHLFDRLESLTFSLLEKGFFVRGAIVKGQLYHDENMVFGEALVHAFKCESEVAKVPRIMITRDVVTDVVSYSAKTMLFSGLLRQADDGPYFLHVLNTMHAMLEHEHDEDDREEYVALCNKIARQVQDRFEKSVDNPNDFQKVGWFANYWNSIAKRYERELRAIDIRAALPIGMISDE